jgi:NAD(P)-dependent dehydrogenase (short-subunit alcohol dehydrogenase family)
VPSVLITGAGRGFGRALVSAFAARRWTLFPLVRDEPAARSLENQGAGSACFPIIADVSRDETETIVAEALRRRGGSLDVLINNAGQIVKNRGLRASSTDEILSLFQVHCLGAFRCVRGALPFLESAQPGTVVNITSRFSSLARTAAGRGSAIYSYQIAKCAQNMLSVCMEQDMRKRGIRVFAVHPGRLKTEAGAPDADWEPREAAEALAGWIGTTPPGPMRGIYDLQTGEILDW